MSCYWSQSGLSTAGDDKIGHYLGKEEIYKIYVESFRGEEHLRRITEEAQTIVDATLKR